MVGDQNAPVYHTRVSNYFFATVPHSDTILRILQLSGKDLRDLLFWL